MTLTDAQWAVLAELAVAEPDTRLLMRPTGTFRGLRDAGLVTLHYSSDGDWAEITAAGRRILLTRSLETAP